MDEKTLKKVVGEVLDDKFSSFYLEPEKHYQEHLWLSGLMEWSEKTKSAILKTIIGIIVAGAIGMMILGFSMFYKGPGN